MGGMFILMLPVSGSLEKRGVLVHYRWAADTACNTAGGKC